MTAPVADKTVTKRPESLAEVDLFSPGAQEYWFDSYQILHAEAPIHRIPGEGAAPGTDAFILVKYDDIALVVRDPDLFPFYNPGEETQAEEIFDKEGFGAVNSTTNTMRPDIEQHKQHRIQITDPWVGSTGSPRHTDMIKRHTNTLIDRWIGKGEVEFVKEFAAPLPQMVIETILGFPLDDIPQLREWEEAQVRRFVFGKTHKNLMTDEEEVENAKTLVAFQQYMKEKLDEKRSNPQDDMVSWLAQVTYHDRKLTDAEVIGVAYGMHIGGNETTQYALTAEAYVLAQRPDIWAEIKTDRSKVRFFVEEALRMYAPTQGLSTRRVARDTELRGVKLAKGSLLHLRYGAGNRDPEEFPDPLDFRLDRPHAGRHLTFSQGPRSCPGSGLSRLEQNVAINLLLDRLDEVHFVPGKNDFKHQPGIMLGMYHLDLGFTAAK
ncbi:MAG: cytochrome P450 [Dehalococcoidia bacterium]